MRMNTRRDFGPDALRHTLDNTVLEYDLLIIQSQYVQLQ